MYGIDSNVKESNVQSKINAGIQDNIKLTSVKFDKLSDGNPPVLQVEFRDEFGSTLREILWEVNEDIIRQYHTPDRTHNRDDKELGFVKGETITVDDRIKMEYRLFNQRCKHIATKFMADEDIEAAMVVDGEGPKNYAQFAQRYAAAFTESRVNSAIVRLKVVLDKKDYPTLPKYPPFIEDMSVPREKTKLQITAYDRITPANADSDSDDPTAVTPDLGGSTDW